MKIFHLLLLCSMGLAFPGQSHAQFRPKVDQPKAQPAMPRPVQRQIIRSRSEREAELVRQIARQSIAKIQKLPQSSGVTWSTQKAVTNYTAGDVSGYGTDWTSDHCEKSIRLAEKKYKLPPYLLHAIALTESGRGGRPSPMAMNIGGRTYIATSTADMKTTVSTNGGSTSSIDVGCLQINLKYHSKRFRNWDALLVPIYNAEYAALYLTELKRELGSWNAAVGAYHSRTPWRSADYACVVSRRWSQIFGWEKTGCGAAIDPMARLMYETYG